jgi:uncharacterized membrane protein
MELVRGAVLVVTTLLTGLASGFFYTWSISIMPTLRGVDDKTFVDFMQKINRDVLTLSFFLSFIGSLLFGLISLILFLGQPFGVLLPVVVSFVSYLICFGVTVRVHVPLNVRLDRKGDPDQISDLAGTRAEFEERWTRFNHVRAWGAFGAVGGMVWALLEYASASA